MLGPETPVHVRCHFITDVIVTPIVRTGLGTSLPALPHPVGGPTGAGTRVKQGGTHLAYQI